MIRAIGNADRRGMTLIELMVVITIFVILVATLLPRILPAIDQRRTREAARMVHTALGTARSRAIEAGRPMGVMFARHPTKAASIVLYQAEVPPPYSGGTMDTMLKVSSGTNGIVGQVTTLNGQSATINSKLVNKGDRIRLNYQGPMFDVVSASDSQITFEPPDGADYEGAIVYPWDDNDNYIVPFQVYRQPIRSPGMPIAMPTGVTVDLSNSGVGDSSSFIADKGDVTITFAPDGSLDRVYYAKDVPQVESQTIHFLIGRRAKLGPQNLEDLSNLWVSVGRSGLITSAQVTSGDPRQLANRHGDAGGF